MAILAAINNGGKRRELDFYPTPREATVALLPLIKWWPRQVWEPCCGDGAISKVLLENGFDVFSSDLAKRGFGLGDIDFFEQDQSSGMQTIVTNPPFGRADDFIQHAHKIGVKRMALLLKVNFWSASTKRRETWKTWRPYLIAPLTWRLDFTGAGRPHTDCMWCLWDVRCKNRTDFEPVMRP